jgi:glycosyltransferase involved in cell wall biosynthesis
MNGISIIICTHNSSKRIHDTLKSILNLNINKSYLFELLIINNNSNDDTISFCNDVLVNSIIPFKILDELKPGLNNARIKGFSNAYFEWVLFCDDDNILDKNYLNVLFEIIKSNSQVGAIGGCGLPLFLGQAPEWFSQFSHSYAVGPQSHSKGIMKIGTSLYGACLAIRKKPILNLIEKNFTTTMTDRVGNKFTSGGDVEFCYLIQLSGLCLYYDDRLIFQHKLDASRLTWEYYIKLKGGIASGVGLLEPYHYIFKNDYNNSFSFLFFYFNKLLKSLLVLLSVNFKAKLVLNNKSDLGLIIVKSKAVSYCVNLRRAYMHYKQIKKTFGATF